MREKLRSLASDTLIYGTSTIVQRFLTFMLTPLYTNFMSMSELGQVNTLYSLIAFVNVLYAFGFETAFLRFYKRDSEDRFAVFTHSYVAIALIALAFSLLGWFFNVQLAYYAGLSGDTAAGILSMALTIPLLDALVLIPFSQLRMERKARRFASLKVLVVLVNVAANVVFVVMMHQGALGVFYAGLVSSALALLLFLPDILKNIRFKFNASLFRQLRNFGLPALPSGFSSIMLQVADRPILNAMTDPATVGLYSANYRLGIPMMLFTSVFEYAWKPFYLSHADDPDAKPLFARVLTYFSVVCAVVFLIVCFFIGNVVQMPFVGGRFIRESYWPGLVIVPIIAASYYFTGLATNFAAGLHITKSTRYLPISTGAAAISNLALNLLLIPLFSYVGAAWATLGAYALSAVVMFIYSQRVYTIQYEWRRLAILWTTTIAVYAMSLWVHADDLWTELSIHVALLIAFVGLLLMSGFFNKNERAGLRAMISRPLRS